MDLLEEIRAKLKRVPDRGLLDLARRAGMPYGTLRSISTGKSQSPRYVTLQKLYAALEDESKLLPVPRNDFTKANVEVVKAGE